MDELFKKYSIEEIIQKTSISPSFLKKLLDNQFDKIDKLKFKGFLKILKSEFKDIDFSDLEEKANSYYFVSDDSQKTGKQQIIEELDKDNKPSKDYFFVIILIIIIAILLYYMRDNDNEKIENNMNLKSSKVEKIKDENETNKTTNVTLEKNKTNKNREIVDNNITNIEKNNSKQNSKQYIDTTLKIEPLKKVWFKVYYLDLNKSKEFMTSKPIELNASKKMFIKFGHGMIKLVYNAKVFFPNRKNITRVIIENKEINITNKKVKNFR
jgi:hypothetical protein